MKKKKTLEHQTLGVLDVLELDIPPQRDKDEAEAHDSGGGDDHEALGGGVSIVDGVALGGSPGVTELDRKTRVDVQVLVLECVREAVVEFARQDAGPDRAGDGGADASADAGAQTQHGEHGGDVLVLGYGHHCELLADHERSAGEGDEYLAHHNVADVDVRLPEVNHEARGQDVQRDSEAQREVLEPHGELDEQADENGEEAGSDAVDVVDVAGVLDALVVHDLHVRVVVRVPAVEGDKDGGREAAGTEDGAVEDELEGDEALAREELLVYSKTNQAETANDEHGDDCAGLPGIDLEVGERHGKQKEHETRADEDDSDHVEFPEVVADLLAQAAVAGRALPDQAGLLRFHLIAEHDPEERNAEERENDGPHTVAPLPG